MRIELTESDVTEVAGSVLLKRAAAGKFLKENKKDLIDAIEMAAREIIEDWVLDEEIDLDSDDEEEEEEDADDDDDAE